MGPKRGFLCRGMSVRGVGPWDQGKLAFSLPWRLERVGPAVSLVLREPGCGFSAQAIDRRCSRRPAVDRLATHLPPLSLVRAACVWG